MSDVFTEYETGAPVSLILMHSADTTGSWMPKKILRNDYFFPLNKHLYTFLLRSIHRWRNPFGHWY